MNTTRQITSGEIYRLGGWGITLAFTAAINVAWVWADNTVRLLVPHRFDSAVQLVSLEQESWR